MIVPFRGGDRNVGSLSAVFEPDATAATNWGTSPPRGIRRRQSDRVRQCRTYRRHGGNQSSTCRFCRQARRPKMIARDHSQAFD